MQCNLRLQEMVYTYEATLAEAGINTAAVRFSVGPFYSFPVSSVAHNWSQTSLENLRSKWRIPSQASREQPTLGPDVARAIAATCYNDTELSPVSDLKLTITDNAAAEPAASATIAGERISPLSSVTCMVSDERRA